MRYIAYMYSTGFNGAQTGDQGSVPKELIPLLGTNCLFDVGILVIWFGLAFFFAVLGFELRTYTLRYSTSSFL
jgi:hypothetical protein